VHYLRHFYEKRLLLTNWIFNVNVRYIILRSYNHIASILGYRIAFAARSPISDRQCPYHTSHHRIFNHFHRTADRSLNDLVRQEDPLVIQQAAFGVII
jgi:hypothetical protein